MARAASSRRAGWATGCGGSTRGTCGTSCGLRIGAAPNIFSRSPAVEVHEGVPRNHAAADVRIVENHQRDRLLQGGIGARFADLRHHEEALVERPVLDAHRGDADVGVKMLAGERKGMRTVA